MPLKDALLAEFDHEMGTTRRLLERVPDDKLSWRPHDRSMTLGALASHVAHLPHWGGVILDGDGFDLASTPTTAPEQPSRTEILAAFERETKQTRALLDRTDAELLARWTLTRDGHEIFSMPRVSAFRTFVLYHTVHHRGQLSVYLRLNGVPVPAIYGPTADEP